MSGSARMRRFSNGGTSYCEGQRPDEVFQGQMTVEDRSSLKTELHLETQRHACMHGYTKTQTDRDLWFCICYWMCAASVDWEKAYRRPSQPNVRRRLTTTCSLYLLQWSLTNVGYHLPQYNEKQAFCSFTAYCSAVVFHEYFFIVLLCLVVTNSLDRKALV